MKKIKNAWRVLIPALCVLAAVLAGGQRIRAEENQTGLQYPDRVIQSGIRIGGVDVSGLTETEALARYAAQVQTMQQTSITLQGQDQDHCAAVTAGELGVVWNNTAVIDEAGSYGHGCNIIRRYKEQKDLEQKGADLDPGLTIDGAKVAEALENAGAMLNQKAVDATLRRENGAFTVVGGTQGYIIDETASAQKITETLTQGWDGAAKTIELAMTVQEPQGDAETLSKIKDVLGSYTTKYPNSGQNRCDNISNASRKLNGITLYPGQQLSVLESITPFTEENGYYLAGSYLGSQVVESFGGGICQVSTTLYNAVIRAELQVNERYNHSLIVSYVEPSMDAAIAESSGMDFKFTNNLQNPVYIESYTEGKSITFKLWGVETRDANRQVSFVSETLETIQPEGVKIYTDSTQPVGYVSMTGAPTGYKARLWKVVTENGRETSREVFNNSSYNAAPVSYTVGTAGTVSEDLSAAIAANDIDLVKAIIANGGTSPSQDPSAAGDAEIAAAAQQVAQESYAAALAAGADETTAMAQAQAAAAAYVAAQTGQ